MIDMTYELTVNIFTPNIVEQKRIIPILNFLCTEKFVFIMKFAKHMVCIVVYKGSFKQ